MNTIEKIESNYSTLTKTEKKIADFILQDSERSLTNMTLLELAKQLKLGEASIVRFCRKMDFQGFHDLKLTMAIELAREEDKGENGEIDRRQEMEKMIHVIQNTDEYVDWKKVEQAVELMDAEGEIYFYGVGSSGLTAEIAETRLIRMGRRSKAIKESHGQTIQSAIMGPKDVLVVISVSGTTNDLYHATKIARDNGAKMIVITNHENSVIAEMADCVLLSNAPESPVAGGTFGSIVSQLYVLDLLFSCYHMKNREKVRSYRDKVAVSINQKCEIK